MKKVWLAAAICFCAFAGSQAEGACRHRDERKAQVSTQGVKRIVIRTGAGDLKVIGEQGRSAVDATGTACTSSAKLLQETRISTSNQGDTLYLDTEIPDTSGFSFIFSLFGDYAYLDLTVRVPGDLPIEIEDSSGDMEVRNIRSAEIRDSSGETRIDDVEADLKLRDSSGDIVIRRVGGNVQVTDTSGDITIKSVRGDVLIPVDTSGDINIDDVDGGVHIEQDTSGGIYIRNVKKDVVVDRDTTGEIRVDTVGGDFNVGAKSSGSIRHERVNGHVRIPDKFDRER